MVFEQFLACNRPIDYITLDGLWIQSFCISGTPCCSADSVYVSKGPEDYSPPGQLLCMGQHLPPGLKSILVYRLDNVKF